MKKVIVVLTVCVLAITGKISAQSSSSSLGTGAGTGKVSTKDFHFIKEGQTTMITKDGKGTLQFVKKANSFSEVIYKDAAGNATKLVPARGVVKGAPGTTCKSDIFFNDNVKNIGMIICKSNTEAGAFHITLDLPDGSTGKASKAQNRRVEVKLSK